MALFTIADLHLSFGCDKPMDVFPGWKDYTARLEKNWRAVVSDQDTVVIAGDIPCQERNGCSKETMITGGPLEKRWKPISRKRDFLP